jgi:hypothetical protein
MSAPKPRGLVQQTHTPEFTRRFVSYAHCTLGNAGDAGVIMHFKNEGGWIC